MVAHGLSGSGLGAGTNETLLLLSKGFFCAGLAMPRPCKQLQSIAGFFLRLKEEHSMARPSEAGAACVVWSCPVLPAAPCFAEKRGVFCTSAKG